MLTNPTESLFAYQRAFVNDSARFKLFVASRQIGKSFVLAFEAVRDCVLMNNREWIAVSRGERQAKKWLEKAIIISTVWCAYASEQGVHISFKHNASSITFSNGSQISALPASPDTIRGYTANVILDEFAYHDRIDDLWSAIYPSISNETNGNLRLIIASTLNGKNNKFWQLFSDPNNLFSKYLVNIYQAKECGLNVSIEELREGLADEDAWKQEYECIPVESGSTLISVDLVNSSMRNSNSCSREISLRELNENYRNFYLGIDIGRKHDLTCVWGLELINGGILRTCLIKELHKMTFAEQRAEITKILACNAVRKCAIDCTGIGAQLSEELASMFANKVIQCQFTQTSKQSIFTQFQRAFQQGVVWLPLDNKGDLQRDICAIQKVYTSNGNIRYFAPSNDDGHSDRATALALAINASNLIDGRVHSLSLDSGSISVFGDFLSRRNI